MRMSKKSQETRVFQRMGFKIAGGRINSICYADDRLLIAGTLNKLQKMMNMLNKEGKRYVMKINIENTKVMQIGKMANNKPIRITLDNIQIGQVTKCKYLGITITDNGRG